jgi:hypothetical protein
MMDGVGRVSSRSASSVTGEEGALSRGDSGRSHLPLRGKLGWMTPGPVTPRPGHETRPLGALDPKQEPPSLFSSRFQSIPAAFFFGDLKRLPRWLRRPCHSCLPKLRETLTTSPASSCSTALGCKSTPCGDSHGFGCLSGGSSITMLAFGPPALNASLMSTLPFTGSNQ